MATRSLSRQELRQRIDRGDAPVLLDVRSRREFERGRVPGAVHLPFWKLPARLREVPAGRDEPVVVYCELGPRAWMAGLWMRACGWKRVGYLRGHMFRWRTDGLDVER